MRRNRTKRTAEEWDRLAMIAAGVSCVGWLMVIIAGIGAAIHG